LRRNKLNKEIIDIIYSYWMEGIKYSDISIITGLNRSTVGRAIKMRK